MILNYCVGKIIALTFFLVEYLCVFIHSYLSRSKLNHVRWTFMINITSIVDRVLYYTFFSHCCFLI